MQASPKAAPTANPKARRAATRSLMADDALVVANDAPMGTVVALDFVNHAPRRSGNRARTRTDDSTHRATDNSAGRGADSGAGRLLLSGACPGQQAQGGNESELLHRLFLQAPTKRAGETTLLRRLSSSEA